MSAPSISRLRITRPGAPARPASAKRRNTPDAVEVPDWRESAACVHQDLNLFFPVSTIGAAAQQQVSAAKRVCADCPVQQACLDWALDVGPEFGIFGGRTEIERRRMRDERSNGSRWGTETGPHRSEAAVREALEPF